MTVRTVAFVLCLALVPALAAADPVTDALDASRAALQAARDAVPASGPATVRIRALLDAGRPDEAAALAATSPDDAPDAEAAAAEAYFAVQDFARLAVLRARWESHGRTDDPEVRRLLYRHLFVVDDLSRIDGLANAHLQGGRGAAVDALAKGRLLLLLLDPDTAEQRFRTALDAARTPRDRGAAHLGLGDVGLKRRDYDAALAEYLLARADTPLDPDLLASLAECLIRLGRTDDAIAAIEIAVDAAPYHERGHYLLGNGYARRNYTQLFAERPDAFASTDPAGRAALAAADSLLESGRAEGAREAYEAVRARFPGRADVLVRLGSLAFAEGDLSEARRRFTAALAVCPEYGRAHNGLAKTLEMERFRVEVHHDADEAAFAERPMPEVPRIEEFVVNWHALSDRHRKMVALAIAPWQRYIPPLIEGGSTYYIKPLYELLSETPGQESLRDQRINYDSRLWDDVRGCGGFHTVTGVEDVERTILGQYNTVLHEFTHQVHAILTADRSRAIRELYRAAKARDEATGAGFLSRYAGGSVWEYFAEGANSLESPKRDAWDTREIVRERLETLDPALERLVVDLMANADVESTYAVALTNQGSDRLERGEAVAALASYRRALERAPDEEGARSAFIFASIAADSTEQALRFAEDAARKDPASGAIAMNRAMALWHAGRGLDAAIDALRRALPGVREEDRADVERELARLLWTDGRAGEAIAACHEALAVQEDDPDALRLLASALALDGELETAWARYDEAVRLRTGIVGLRNDYATDLLRAGLNDRAAEQVDAALLLDPEDGDALALRGWIELAAGRAGDAVASASRGLEVAPWSDLAVIVKGAALRALGRGDEADATLAPLRRRVETDAPPELVYLPRWGRYEEAHTLPAVIRALSAEMAGN